MNRDRSIPRTAVVVALALVVTLEMLLACVLYSTSFFLYLLARGISLQGVTCVERTYAAAIVVLAMISAGVVQLTVTRRFIKEKLSGRVALTGVIAVALMMVTVTASMSTVIISDMIEMDVSQYLGLLRIQHSKMGAAEYDGPCLRGYSGERGSYLVNGKRYWIPTFGLPTREWGLNEAMVCPDLQVARPGGEAPP